MINGLEMSMDGIPALEGTTWWSRDGSRHFTVRDIVSDGSQMIIRTTSGQMIPFDTINNYIQSETPIKIPKVNPNMGKINLGSLEESNPAPVASDDFDLLPDDLIAMGEANTNPIIVDVPEASSQVKPIIPNYDIIDKAMAKVAEPHLGANIIWDDYPSRELELLKDIMDIPADDIANYIYLKWFDGKLKDMVVRQIKLDLGID